MRKAYTSTCNILYKKPYFVNHVFEKYYNRSVAVRKNLIYNKSSYGWVY